MAAADDEIVQVSASGLYPPMEMVVRKNRIAMSCFSCEEPFWGFPEYNRCDLCDLSKFPILGYEGRFKSSLKGIRGSYFSDNSYLQQQHGPANMAALEAKLQLSMFFCRECASDHFL